MLQLVLGIAGTGKTTWLLNRLRTRAKGRHASILLVPEQFSSSAEMLVLEALGDAKSAYVEVLSFRTLAERILRESGGGARRILSDAGRAVYVKRALAAAEGKLRSLGRSGRGTAFCNLCAHTLAELKTAGANPESLAEIAQQTGDVKLADLAAIFAAYDAILAGSAMDPDDRLTLAAEGATPATFAGKACLIDNFDGFTAPEYKLLESLMAHCEEVAVALCCDEMQENEGGLGLFSPVRATAQRLMQRAGRLGLACPAPIKLPLPRRCENGDLLALNLLLAGRLPKAEVCTDKLTLTEAADRYTEVKMAAAEMRRLAGAGVSYGKMALVCREVNLYETIVRREMGLFDIPWHSDTPETIEFTAPVAFLRAALALLRQGLGSGPILQLLKTGLCGFDEYTLAALENYVFTWRPKAAEWRAPFAQNPLGLLRAMDDEAAEKLALAEGARSLAIPLLEDFTAKAKGTSPRELSVLLYRLLEAFEAPKHLEEHARLLEQNGDYPLAENSRRAWDLAMEMLDQMAYLLEGEELSVAEYDELFLLLVRSTDFGQTPGAMESVLFTGADRMRLANPDYCFVLGLLEGEFPSQVGYSGLLTHADRDLLVENGIEMPGSFQNRILLEEMFLYRALTSPRQGLYLFWPSCHAGVPGVLCSALRPLVRLLNPGPMALAAPCFAPTPGAAFDRLCALYRENTPEGATLLLALRQSGLPKAENLLPLLHAAEAPRHFTVSRKESLQKLTGSTLRLSPTRAEGYFTCHFAYFMEHVLRLRPRPRAELSPLESGTFVHHLLEQVLQQVQSGLAACSKEELAALTERFANEFIEANFPNPSLRTRLLLARIAEATLSLLLYLRAWAQNSAFTISALELPIGGEGGATPLTIKGEDGQKVQITGQVDRVDILHKNGKTYLCVLDYKTGSRRFDLGEVLYGLNTQMLVYMDALRRQKNGPYAGALPAGMLYLSSDPAPASGSRGEGDTPLFKLDGLVLDDPEILKALDSDQSGIFLPIKYKKDGSPGACRQLASLQRIGGLSLYIEQLLRQMANGVSAGEFSAKPLVKSDGSRHCDYCPYRACCRHEDGQNEQPMLKQEEALAEIDAMGAKGGEKLG